MGILLCFTLVYATELDLVAASMNATLNLCRLDILGHNLLFVLIILYDLQTNIISLSLLLQISLHALHSSTYLWQSAIVLRLRWTIFNAHTW